MRHAAPLVLVIALSSVAHAALVWDGGGDNVSVFAEANWTDNSGTPGTNPPADSVNGAQDVLFDCIIGGSTNAGGGGGVGNHFDLGDGFSLTITGSASWLSNTGNGYGIRGSGGGATEGLILNTGGTVTTTFFGDLAVSISGGTDLVLTGGGNPVNASTIDFGAGWTGELRFTDETPAAVQAEHVSKITVAGAAAIVGGNIEIVTSGAGSIVRFPVVAVGTDDSDGDGLSNDAENNIYSTDPTLLDSDGDGTPDGMEIANGLDPNNPAESLTRPNIVFFFVDDLGYGDIGCFWQDQKVGIQKFDTPGIDQMAAEGAKLTHHYISASVCAPSRASLLQGRHQGHSQVRNSQFDKALEDNHTLGRMLQSAGYRTIHVGKAGLAGGENSGDMSGTGSANLGAHPLDRGYDEFFGYLFHNDGHEHYPRNGTTNKVAHIFDGYQRVENASLDLYTTDAWTAYAKEAIITEAEDGDNQPFFVYLAYDTPHQKMQRPAVAYPPLSNDGNPRTGGIQWTTQTDGAGRVRFASTATGTGTIDGFNHPDNNPAWPLSNQQHVGMIRRIDNSIADIIQTLKDLGIDDNTLLVFTSDNGPHNEQHNPRYFESFADMEGIKRDMWEAGIRVPTVVRWPGNIAGATGDENDIHEIDYPCAIWDWMPTFADMAGVPAPSWCDGVSLLPTLTGNGAQRDKGYLYFEFQNGGSTPNWTEFPNHGGDTKGEMQCLRVGDLMGVRTGIGSANDNFEIYDVTVDPGQANNLAASMPQVQAQMKALAVTSRRPEIVSRPYDNANLPALNLAAEPGIDYAAYEGFFQWVPELRDLTPAMTGTASNIDVANHATRPENVALLYTGYIQVPAAGSYTFYVASDSGANLFIHDAHVIDDDFHNDGGEQSATVRLEAGLHPFRLYYRHGAGAMALDWQWSGPGFAKRAVAAGDLFRAGTPPPEPVATDDTATTTGGTAVVIDVLANDFDDGAPAPLSIDHIGTPQNGTTSEVGDQVHYTPEAGFFGTDTFSYRISDGEFFATAQVRVSVTYQTDELWVPLNACADGEVYEAGGTLLGSMASFDDNSAARIAGVHGFAMRFDGIDDQVSLPGVAPAMLPVGTAPRTVMCWVRIQPGAAFENQTMFGYGQNSNGQRFSFRTNGSAGSPAGQELRLEVQGGNIIGNAALDDGQWHHVAAVVDDFDGNGTLAIQETKLYVDGVLDTNPADNSEPIIPASASATEPINTAGGTTPMLGGSNHSGNYNFAGDIDELRLFPFAMTTAQVQAQMAASNEAAVVWHRRNLGSAAIGWGADDDGDGLSRLGEYAFGGNPHLADPQATSPKVFLNSATQKLETTFTRLAAGSHNLLYKLEVSADLLDWDTLTATEIGTTPLSPALCLERVTFETDATTAAERRQFTRATVELLP